MSLVEVDSVGEIGSNSQQPSLVLVVYNSEEQHMGIKALLDPVKDFFPATPIAILSSQDDPDSALEAVRSGAKGFISTLVRSQAVVPALRVLLAGGEFVLTSALLPHDGRNGSQPHPGSSTNPNARLSPREREVFHLLRQGKPNKVIASDLSVAENTVKVHVRNILKKMKARSRMEVLVAKPPLPHRRAEP